MGPKEKGKTNEGTRQFSPRAASFGTLRGEIIAVDDVDFSRVFFYGYTYNVVYILSCIQKTVEKWLIIKLMLKCFN